MDVVQIGLAKEIEEVKRQLHELKLSGGNPEHLAMQEEHLTEKLIMLQCELNVFKTLTQ